MDKDPIQENSFEAAPGGSSGTLNYQTPYGTPQGGNVVQDPDHFASSDSSPSRFVPNTTNGSGEVSALPKRNDRVGDKVSKGLGTTQGKNEPPEKKPLDPTKNFDPQVDQIFKNKKNTPSPDEIMSALQYELSNMVKKDKHIAKQQVLDKLKQDPQYYSKLGMLNIDDKKMKVDETTFSKTKSVLDKMIADRQKGRVVAASTELSQIFKDLTDRRLHRTTLK